MSVKLGAMLRTAGTVLLLAVSLLVCGCVGASYSAPKAPGSAPAAIGGQSRNNCDQIYGTAFRSPEERDWFSANCSHWPASPFIQRAPGAAPGATNVNAPTNPGPACDAVRGHPYASQEQRTWYLTNCTDAALAAAAAKGTAPAPPPPGTALAPPPSTPAQTAADRTDCDAIRGTPYTSDNERNWYLANCQGQQQQQPGVPPGYQIVQQGTLPAVSICDVPLQQLPAGLLQLRRQVCH